MGSEPAEEGLAIVGLGEAGFGGGELPFADEAPGFLGGRGGAGDLEEVGGLRGVEDDALPEEAVLLGGEGGGGVAGFVPLFSEPG